MEDDHNRGTADGGYRATGIGEGSMADLPTITPAMPISRGAARLAQVTAATFVVLLTVLHCVKPEPTRRGGSSASTPSVGMAG